MREQSKDSEGEYSLIRGMQDGDCHAFEAIFEKYRRSVLAYVAALVRDVSLAEDIVQETFVELVRRLQDIDPEKGVSGWLYRVARNKAIDLMRRRKHEVQTDIDGVNGREAVRSSGESRDPAGEVVRRELVAGVRRALAALSVKERDLLMLRFYGGLTFKEISRIVRRPLGTVLWQVRRSVGKMRTQLQDEL